MSQPTKHRKAPALKRETDTMTKGMMDMGKIAVGGAVTIGVLGALGGMLKK